MSNEALFDYAETKGHEVLYMNLDENKAVTIEDGQYSIILANGLTRAEEKELAAHELGHCEYGGTYCRFTKYDIKAKAEYRANKWAYYQLVSPDEITEYVRRGLSHRGSWLSILMCRMSLCAGRWRIIRWLGLRRYVFYLKYLVLGGSAYVQEAIYP